MKAATFATFFLLVACLFSSSFAVVQPVQAATACEGEVAAPEWNTTAQRLALVPHGVYGTPFMFEEMYDDDMDDDGGKRAPVASTGELDPLLHPEETWMYNPVWPLPTLEPLTTGQYANMQVGNDSAGVLRFNLSSAHRTTFCISLFTLVDNQTVPADGDVYLMTASQYDSYQEVYRMMHGGWWWDDLDLAGGDSNLLSDVPPEWRSFNPLGWQTYRDAHQYESRQEATFSVALDGPEVYTALFGGAEWQDFYLVIDAWDNTNDGDAGATNRVLVADVTVIPTERTALLPPWTVPLTLFVALAAVVVVPVVLNKRYMEAGLDGSASSKDASVPFLEQQGVPGTEEGLNTP